MMNALPVLIVVWAVVTGLFLALLAYNATITRYEENQLFLDDASASANEQQQQSSILRKVNKVLPMLRVLGGTSAILTILIIAIYTWTPPYPQSNQARTGNAEEPASVLRSWLSGFVKSRTYAL
jgi:hypothetical protein